MSRYINVDDLIEAIKAPSFYDINQPDFISLVSDQPTADVAPVRRGEWEVAIGYDPNKKVQCQNCYKMAYEPTAYCPNCGARMGGKEENRDE